MRKFGFMVLPWVFISLLGCSDTSTSGKSSGGLWSYDYQISEGMVYHMVLDLSHDDYATMDGFVNGVYNNGIKGAWTIEENRLVIQAESCFKGNAGVKSTNDCSEDWADGSQDFGWDNGTPMMMGQGGVMVPFNRVDQ